MVQRRVYEIAKDEGLSGADALRLAQAAGIGARSASTPISAADDARLVDLCRQRRDVLDGRERRKGTPMDEAVLREALTSVTQSRDKWRGALIAVMGEHAMLGRCKRCGKDPCPTWQTLERVNFGIAKDVEDHLARPIAS